MSEDGVMCDGDVGDAVVDGGLRAGNEDVSIADGSHGLSQETDRDELESEAL